MPLYLRQVWPVAVGRKYTPESSTFERRDPNSASGVYDNLVYSKEESANRALANIIRQLADLGKKSHQIFGGSKNTGLLFGSLSFKFSLSYN